MNKCLICSTEFTPALRHPKQKFCSSKCIKTNYRRNHPEKDRASKSKWLLQNPEQRKKSSAEYVKRNSEYYAEYSSLRRRYCLKAKPSWVDESKLKEFYHLAKELGLEVDHIIPLKHDQVCGLHVPWNLQLLTRSENAKKSNRFNVDEDVVTKLED